MEKVVIVDAIRTPMGRSKAAHSVTCVQRISQRT